MAGALSDLYSVVQTANDIRASIDKWYDVSGQMKLFYDQLCRLSNDHQIWEDQVRKFGLSDDEDLLQKIRDAQAVLDEEKDKLFGQNGRARRSSKIKLWFCPAKLESSIRKVTAFCQDLNNRISLTREKEIEAVARQRVLQKASSFSFFSDSRYIPLKETEEKVKKALESTGEPSIVLLHGGSGTGKSAMARNLALHFQQEAQERSGGLLSHSLQSSNSRGALFEKVLYLECGPNVSLAAKQRELVEQLDASSSNYEGTDTDADGKSRFNTNLLSGLLKERSLLIILDDVWKPHKKSASESFTGRPSFLKGMTRYGGQGVKWLITSQSEDLLNHLNIRDLYSVRMEAIKFIDARRILASLTGLKESDIPELQDVMDGIIKKTGANLLALACVASNMSPKRNKEEEEWKRLENDLLATLKSADAMEMQGIDQGRSYWAAIKFGIERLSPPEQYLLYLMQMCSGPSVPSGVIEYLFQQTRQESWCEGFSKARNELEGKQLLIVRKVVNVVSEVEESWSIHDLLRGFLKEDMRTLAGSVIETIAEGKFYDISRERVLSKLELDVLINVAYLYFNEDCQEQLASKIDMLPKMSHLADLRKRTISPITKLFMWADDKSLRCSSLQVFLKYTNDGMFEEAQTSNLLNSSVYKAAMLKVLWNSAMGEHHPPIEQQIISTLLTLLESQTALIVASPLNRDSAREIGGLLRWISYVFAKSFQQSQNKRSATQFTSARFQTVLHSLTSGLLGIDEINVWCARALANLALGGGEIKVKMIDVPDLLPNLITAMRRDDSLDCQVWAARTLSNLARGTVKIVEFPGVLEALRTGLENPKNVELQKSSAWALANLASWNDEVRLKIMACEGSLRKLVSLILEVDNHDVKKPCVNALANLTNGGRDIRIKMLEIPDLLQNLVIAMGRNDSHLQVQAARTLSNLARGTAEIVKFPGVLEALRTGLENQKNLELQKSSAWALANLASWNDEVRFKIMACEGSLRKLVSLIVKVDNHDVKKPCLNALANLTNGGRDILIEMVEIPDLLQNLVIAMGRDDSYFQAQAARTLSNLARGTSKIVEFPGVLEALRSGLENPKKVELQKSSAWALANLANWSDVVRSKIMICEGVLRKLVSLMVDVDSHDMNKQCARTLANLANGGGDIPVKMIDIPDLLSNLVLAMRRDDSPDCQAEAARALSNLARSTAMILEFPGVLEALRIGLENSKKVELQKSSAQALANLADWNDEARSKIMACEGTVRKLMSLMVDVNDHDVNKQCARALANLANGGGDIPVKMIDIPDLLPNLVLAMRRDDSPDCQAAAARTLSNLARGTAKIGDFPGVLEAVRTGLENPKKVELQKSSAQALANLANWNDETRSKIMACGGTVRKLASLTVEVDNHDVNKQCARALANLAKGGGDIPVKMIDIPDLLPNLVIAMRRDDSPDCQAAAARTLSNLARGTAKIGDFPGVPEAVRTGLENPKKVELQKSSAQALANLADWNDETRSKIMVCGGTVRKLASLMVEVDNHDVNKQCARALANLAKGGGDIPVKMIDIPDLLPNLVIAMGRDDFPDFQVQAARALSNMARGTSKIVESSGVLEALRIGLENPNNVELQKTSAWALANMAKWNDEVRS